MALEAKLNDDLKAALLSGNRFLSDTLRGLKAVILDEKVATGKRESGLEDSEIEKLFTRELKKRREAAELYHQNNREDLATNEEAEAEVIASYLPKPLTEAEINEVVERKVSELGADIKQMGQVIGAVKQELGASADGAVIAKLVKQKLS